MGDGDAPGALGGVEGDLERGADLAVCGIKVFSDQFFFIAGGVKKFQMEDLSSGGSGSGEQRC